LANPTAVDAHSGEVLREVGNGTVEAEQAEPGWPQQQRHGLSTNNAYRDICYLRASDDCGRLQDLEIASLCAGRGWECRLGTLRGLRDLPIVKTACRAGAAHDGQLAICIDMDR